MNNLRINTHEIRKTLDILRVVPNQVTELRVLDAVRKECRVPHVFSGYFDSIDALIDSLDEILHAKGYYITLQPVIPDLLARRCNRAARAEKGDATKDSEILQRVWLPIDVDPTRPSGISSSDEEHESAIRLARKIREYLCKSHWPDPILADSGNGAHLLYRIDMPTDDGGMVKEFLQSLDLKFSNSSLKVDTSVYNPARIWKLYGTPVRKGDSTPERPHRMAKILEVPNENC